MRSAAAPTRIVSLGGGGDDEQNLSSACIKRARRHDVIFIHRHQIL